MEVGETFTMDVIVRRKWWQLWKPRSWTERRSFMVADVARSQLVGGVGWERIPYQIGAAPYPSWREKD